MKRLLIILSLIPVIASAQRPIDMPLRYYFNDSVYFGKLTAGRIPFITDGKRFTDVNGLAWDNPTTRLYPTFISLSASGTGANMSSIKISEGAAQTSPENGALNYVNNNLEFTESSTTYVLAKTLKATATLDFGSPLHGASEDLTITVTGAATGDPVALAILNSVASGLLVYTAWVSSTNTVTVRVFNASTTDSSDIPSASFTVAVIHY